MKDNIKHSKGIWEQLQEAPRPTYNNLTLEALDSLINIKRKKMNIFKKLWNSFLLYFTIAKVRSNSSSHDTIVPSNVEDIISTTREVEANWFQRENNLVEEFKDDPPIVYSSNLNDKTIRKEDQYGYIGDNGKLNTVKDDPDDMLADDIGFLKNAKGYFGKENIRIPKTIVMPTDKADFEERWGSIKKKIVSGEIDGELEEEKQETSE